MRENSDHCQHYPGKKAEHRNRLQNIEQRNHDHFGAAGAGRRVAKSQSKEETDRISDDHANQGIESIKRKIAGILRNVCLGMSRTEPGPSNGVNPEDHGEHKKKHGTVDQKSPTLSGTRRALRGRRKRRGMSGGKRSSRHSRLRTRSGSACRTRRRTQKSRRSAPIGWRFRAGGATLLR